ncbi:LCP family protein [Streptacidiphilus neutrinimicus]|uniref:LCP family protein n=1 Tax=Streptacidiphilus neutrinimicus TaxID=105420 RepID=UPI0005A9C84E|nr:LCP family protein [Streptacidiphilus neutrinimicus]
MSDKWAKLRGTRSRRAVRILALCAAVVVLLCGAGAGWVYWRLSHNLKTVDLSGELTPPAQDASGAMNVLVLGSDSRSGANGQLAGGQTDGTARSDTAMVVHVNQAHTAATVVSIPRDALVDRPACGKDPAASGVMFNTAFEVGGASCAVRTVESMTGLGMNHYLEVDFSGFAKLIDALGGVDVTTTIPIADDLSGLHLPAGTHHLGGDEALAFVRTRHGVGDGSDLGRIQLQQEMVKSVLKQVENLDLFSSPTKLFSIADAATGSVTTDSTLGSVHALLGFAEGLQHVKSTDITGVTMPTATAPGDPNRLVALQGPADELWSALKADQPVPASVMKLQPKNPADS